MFLSLILMFLSSAQRKQPAKPPVDWTATLTSCLFKSNPKTPADMKRWHYMVRLLNWKAGASSVKSVCCVLFMMRVVCVVCVFVARVCCVLCVLVCLCESVIKENSNTYKPLLTYALCAQVFSTTKHYGRAC